MAGMAVTAPAPTMRVASATGLIQLASFFVFIAYFSFFSGVGADSNLSFIKSRLAQRDEEVVKSRIRIC
jgi:hypothetical protein